MFNAALCVVSFYVGVFATSPQMQDVTMRFGFYVINAIVVAAFAGIFAPWLFAFKNRHKSAIFFATLPAYLVCIAILLFLTLDSWLQRTFAT